MICGRTLLGPARRGRTEKQSSAMMSAYVTRGDGGQSTPNGADAKATGQVGSV